LEKARMIMIYLGSVWFFVFSSVSQLFVVGLANIYINIRIFLNVKELFWNVLFVCVVVYNDALKSRCSKK